MADERVRITLEEPYRGKGYRIRWGSEAARRNPAYDAYRPQLGGPYLPGKPNFYPPEGDLIAGDPKTDSVIVPIDVAKGVFGDWEAPEQQVVGDTERHTRAEEAQRLARRFDLKRHPPSNGSFNPDMAVIGLNDYPKIAIRPLDARGNVLNADDGSVVVIRPFEFFGFTTMQFEQAATGERSELDALKAAMAEQQSVINQLITAGGSKRGSSSAA